MRDTQRQRVYDAEGAAGHDPIGRGSVPEVQAFVDRITRSAWWIKREGATTILVKDGRRRYATACANWDGSISVPRHMRDQGIVLHELAHQLAGLHEVHGPRFTAAFLALVRYVHGEERYKALRASFRSHHVKIGPLPKPTRQLPKVTCRGCGRSRSRKGSWFIPGTLTLAAGSAFCTKKCALTWASQNVRQRVA